jgi:acetyl esterase/lipase
MPLPQLGRVSVEVVRNLIYRRVSNQALRLDLYLPRQIARPLPVIVSIHGGGWASGHRSQGPAWMLARHGYAVATVEQRFAPAAIFPAQLEDCEAAVDWLRSHAAEYGFAPERLGAWGHSTGGHLASLLGTAGRVRAVCAVSSPADLVNVLRLPDTRLRRAVVTLLGGPAQATIERATSASPSHQITRASAAFLLIHGAKDQTVPVDQSRRFAAVLTAAGVETQLHIFPNARHALWRLRADAMIKQFFDKHLQPA